MTTRIGIFGFTSRAQHAATTLSLGSGLAMAQNPSLIVDLSGQGGLTDILGLQVSDSGALTSVVTGSAPPEDLGLLVRTVDVGLDLVPACGALESTPLVDQDALDRAIKGVEELYSAILIHCPGRALTLTRSTLASTSRLVVHLGDAEDSESVARRHREWSQQHPLAQRRRVHYMVEGWRFPEGWGQHGGERWHLIPETREVESLARRAFESEWVTQPEAWVFGNLARELLQGE